MIKKFSRDGKPVTLKDELNNLLQTPEGPTQLNQDHSQPDSNSSSDATSIVYTRYGEFRQDNPYIWNTPFKPYIPQYMQFPINVGNNSLSPTEEIKVGANEARTLLANENTIDDDNSLYFEGSMEEIKVGANEARRVLANENVTIDQVNDALNPLNVKPTGEEGVNMEGSDLT